LLNPHNYRAMSTTLSFLLNSLHELEMFFRLENDEEGFYLSIIDRSKYPRVWSDNFQDGTVEIIAETTDHMINRTISSEKDWKVRLYGKTIDELMTEYNKWDSENRKPGLK
jgi:hypothetical protein